MSVLRTLSLQAAASYPPRGSFKGSTVLSRSKMQPLQAKGTPYNKRIPFPSSVAFLSNRTAKKGGEGNSLRQLRDGSTTSLPHQLLSGMALHHLDPLTWSEKASFCLRRKFKTVSQWSLPVKVTVSLHRDGSHPGPSAFPELHARQQCKSQPTPNPACPL